MRIAVFIPCYVDQVVPTVGVATVKLLRRLGHEVVYPQAQTCCGQPAFNTGYWKEAAEVAKRAVTIFAESEADAVVCPSGSCTAMQKVFYPTLLADSSCSSVAEELANKTYDLPQFLVDVLGMTDVGARFPGTATLHRSCHSLRELGARNQARTLLDHVSGLEVREMDSPEECCGFGGTFAVKSPEISTAMGEVKIDAIERTGADWVISGDSSCLFHLAGLMDRRSRRTKAIHIAEVLASTDGERATL